MSEISKPHPHIHPEHPLPSETQAATTSLIQPLLWILALESVGGIIGYLISPETTSAWYLELNKPDANPSSWVFGVVWPTLYAMIAIAGYRIWQRRGIPGAQWLWPLFLVQLLMNWAWSFIFFSGHQLWPSFYWLIALTALIATLVIMLWRHDRVSAYLMLPYMAWSGFATYLAWYIANHNI